MRQAIRYLIPLLWLTWLPLAATEEADKPYEGPFYPPPAGAPMPASLTVESFTLDGYSGYRSVVSCHLFSATTFAPEKWTPAKIPGTSFAYQGKFFPQVKWSMSVWAPDSFMPDLSNESMTGYAEALMHDNPGTVEILNYESYRRNVIPSIFNRDPRILIYDKTNPADGKVMRHYNSFVLFKNHLIEFSIWGPPNEVQNLMGWFTIIPENLSLTTDDESYRDDLDRAYGPSKRAMLEALRKKQEEEAARQSRS